MAVIRQGAWYSQQRIDIPHIRALESAVVGDFDLLAGQILAGSRGLVIKGFSIPYTFQQPSEGLELIVAGGVVLHPNASDHGSMFFVPSTRKPELLARSNGKVQGSFSASARNYVGIDLRRSADLTSVDTVKFIDADTEKEFAKVVPTSRTLDYTIFIGTQSFAFNPWILPLAIVQTDANNNVVSVKDARPMMYRLGTGGDSPDANGRFPWSTRAFASSAVFSGGDKDISSQKAWQDAVMTRLWELGGGESWYAATTDRTLKIAYGQPTLSGGLNALLTGNTLTWSGIKVLFSNTTATTNTVSDNTVGVPFPDGSCLYVDVNPYVDNATLIPVVGNTKNLGLPTTPGTRVPLIWRVGTQIFLKDAPYESGRTVSVATTGSEGVVRLERAAISASNPKVLTDSTLHTLDPAFKVAPVNASGELVLLGCSSHWTVNGDVTAKGAAVGTPKGSLGKTDALWEFVFCQNLNVGRVETSLLPKTAGLDVGGSATSSKWRDGWFSGTLNTVSVKAVDGTYTGPVSAAGVTSTGLLANAGVSGTGGPSGAVGIYGKGTGNKAGVSGTGGDALDAPGVSGIGGAKGGAGVIGEGTLLSPGVWGIGPDSSQYNPVAGVQGEGRGEKGMGVFGLGGGRGIGVRGIGGDGAGGIGVYGTGGLAGGAGVQGDGTGLAGSGVVGVASGNGDGVFARGGTGTGSGVYGIGGTNGGTGIRGEGKGTGPGVSGKGDPSGIGAGVYGESATEGVKGKGSTGVIGEATIPSGTGVRGSALLGSTGTGVFGEGSLAGVIAHGVGTSSTGLSAQAGGSGNGVEARATSGIAVNAVATTGAPLRLVPQSSAPTSPLMGMMYCTTSGVLRFYDGSAWKTVTLT